ncbi:MAG: hypothetical protein R3C61_03760 [Bacteroidia bacterium]
MKKILNSFFLLFAVCVFWASAQAQAPLVRAKQVLTLSIQGSGGTNGSSVVYDASKGLYYTVIAGNAAFPLEAFDAKGKPVAQSEAGADTRGMWMNGTKLEGNGAGELGWVEFDLSSSGRPSGTARPIAEGQIQPDFQSVGTFDPKKKQVMFFDVGKIVFYSRKKMAEAKSLQLQSNDAYFPDNINYTTVGFTGQKGYEYALLNYATREVFFFNRKGNQTGSTKLPTDASVNQAFRFAFANGYLFLYDVDSRSWAGYQVF